MPLFESARRLELKYFGFYYLISFIFSHRPSVQSSASTCKGRWLKFLPPRHDTIFISPCPSCPKKSLTGFAHLGNKTLHSISVARSFATLRRDLPPRYHGQSKLHLAGYLYGHPHLWHGLIIALKPPHTIRT